MSTDLPIDRSTRRLVDYLVGQAGGCEECGSNEGVAREPARTAYHYEGELETIDDPNRSIALCREHAAEHHEYWDGMWADYYAGRL